MGLPTCEGHFYGKPKRQKIANNKQATLERTNHLPAAKEAGVPALAHTDSAARLTGLRRAATRRSLIKAGGYGSALAAEMGLSPVHVLACLPQVPVSHAVQVNVVAI